MGLRPGMALSILTRILFPSQVFCKFCTFIYPHHDERAAKKKGEEDDEGVTSSWYTPAFVKASPDLLTTSEGMVLA